MADGLKLAHSRPADRASAGAVYTPQVLAEWVASLLAEFGASGCNLLVDFGSGNGALLAPAADAVRAKQVAGVDLSAEALREARSRLGDAPRLLLDDVLTPEGYQPGVLSVAQYWVSRLGLRPDAIVMNPPWGGDIRASATQLAQGGFTLATGQFDTYDLFCELALQIAAPGALCTFIIPDSLLLPEHAALRRMLLDCTSILLLARLGEGFFEGVYRGAMVVVARKTTAGTRHRVECMRLPKDWRERVLSGEATLTEARRSLSHTVEQSRFAGNSNAEFDLDVSGTDTAVFKIAGQGGDWAAELVSGRGVELSKSGVIVECSHCGTAKPLPREMICKCNACGQQFVALRTTAIIAATNQGPGWAPFIAGEDVARYRATPSRWIKQDVPGIRYKAIPIKGRPRLLVRKTGVGLNAALDTSAAFTNQVVFDYQLPAQSHLPDWYLSYVLGVLCSRVMFAYHIRRNGEAEWRSHPYVTQKTLAALPVPTLKAEGSQQRRQAKAVAAAVEKHRHTYAHDLEIEGLVAGLFGLDQSECGWVASVLDSAQSLAPMKALRLRAGQLITPIVVI